MAEVDDIAKKTADAADEAQRLAAEADRKAAKFHEENGGDSGWFS